MKSFYKVLRYIPIVALALACIKIPANHVYRLHNYMLSQGYRIVVSNKNLKHDYIDTNDSNSVLKGCTGVNSTPTPEIAVDFQKKALFTNQPIKYDNLHPIANICEQTNIVDNQGHIIHTLYDDEPSDNKVKLFTPIHYLSKAQYRIQQLQKHEYKIFCYDSSTTTHSNYLSAYVPLYKINNDYYYKIDENKYISASAVDMINGHYLVAQNIPCYSKTFNCYGYISNTIVAHGQNEHNFVFSSPDEIEHFCLTKTHLNFLDPSNPNYSAIIKSQLKVDQGSSSDVVDYNNLNTFNAFVPQASECVNSANVMPAICLTNDTQGKPYFSKSLMKNKYIPYIVGAMTTYGIQPTSKYFFDFTHLKHGQVNKLISNYNAGSLAKPNSYYYDLNNHFGLLISKSAKHKYWASDNGLINSPQKRQNFFMQTGYYVPYKYEQNVHNLLSNMCPSWLYTKNPYYVRSYKKDYTEYQSTYNDCYNSSTDEDD